MQYKFVTLEKKRSPVKNNRNFKRLSSILLILLCLLGGIGLLLRGYFLGNPLFFNNTDLKTLNPELKPNEVVALESFKGEPLRNGEKLFGDAIKTTTIPQFVNSKAWLKVLNRENLIVGYLDKSDNFVQVYKLPADVTLVHLYDDESISYVLNPVNGSQARLFGQDRSGNLYPISGLSLGEYFSSTWFDPSEKGFYVSVVDAEGFFSVRFINQKSEMTKIFTTTTFGKETFIISSSSTSVDLKSGSTCYSLILENKSLKNITCPDLQTNITPVDNLNLAVNPEGTIISSFIFNAGKYLITKTNSESYHLLKYSNPEEPSSYPSDYYKKVDLKSGDLTGLNLI